MVCLSTCCWCDLRPVLLLRQPRRIAEWSERRLHSCPFPVETSYDHASFRYLQLKEQFGIPEDLVSVTNATKLLEVEEFNTRYAQLYSLTCFPNIVSYFLVAYVYLHLDHAFIGAATVPGLRSAG